MRKLLALIAAAIGAAAVAKSVKDNNAEARLWAEATDSPSN